MDYKQIQELIKLVNKLGMNEVKIADKDFSILIRNKDYQKGGVTPTVVPVMAPPTVMPAPQPVAAPPVVEPPKTKQAPEAKPAEDENLQTIKSPMIGTFYRSASPDKPPFIKVGDTIEKGQVICIVEAMKLFNEIESEVSGKVVKIIAENASPVEYDTPLFLVEPV